jgi:hypothetical protein
MPSRLQPDVVKISTPGDMVCAACQMLGFVPRNSVAVMCLHGERRRVGLVMRFGFELAEDPRALAASIGERVRHDEADSVYVVVFADGPSDAETLPHTELIGPIVRELGSLLSEALLTIGDRWWSYLCGDPRCCPAEGGVVDRRSPGATALNAAHAMRGQGILPSREAVVASIAYSGGAEQAAAMGEVIDAAIDRQIGVPQAARRLAVKSLLSRLCAASHDPRAEVSEIDAAELAALCEDVVVRDEVLIRARKPRRRVTLVRVLTQVARLLPPPFDAPVCATLAWISYAAGDGVVANVAVDRALATNPHYSLAGLIDDALTRQVPPYLLEEVMREAARDLRSRA